MQSQKNQSNTDKRRRQEQGASGSTGIDGRIGIVEIRPDDDGKRRWLGGADGQRHIDNRCAVEPDDEQRPFQARQDLRNEHPEPDRCTAMPQALRDTKMPLQHLRNIGPRQKRADEPDQEWHFLEDKNRDQ